MGINVWVHGDGASGGNAKKIGRKVLPQLVMKQFAVLRSRPAFVVRHCSRLPKLQVALTGIHVVLTGLITRFRI